MYCAYLPAGLIKTDFFSEFGNQRELLRIVEVFDKFKGGAAKKVSRDYIDGTPLEEIIRKHATWLTKAGTEAKQYTLTDVMAILREAEDAIKAVGMEDLSDIIKVQNFKDAMGYVGYVSGAEEDRRKLYVLDVKPNKTKTGTVWSYSVFTKSIGSGKESRFTVRSRLYKSKPLSKGDIVLCKAWTRERQWNGTKEYFHMTDYEHVV